MLGKIMKFEWKQTIKFMSVIYIILAIATAMGSFGLHSINKNHVKSDLLLLVSVTMFALYVITFISICIITFVYQCYRYYQTSYSAQGYLTYTLPVKPITILNGKLIISFCWILLTGLLSCASILVLMFCTLGNELFTYIFSLDWTLIGATMKEELGMSYPLFILYILVSILLSCLSYLLFVYLCMAIGQLFHSNRVAFSVLAGFIIYILMQIINTLVMLVTGYHGFADALAGKETSGIPISLWIVTLLLSIFYVVAMYLGIYKITQNHLNLE